MVPTKACPLGPPPPPVERIGPLPVRLPPLVAPSLVIRAAYHFETLRCIPGGTVTDFEIKLNSQYLGVFFDIPGGLCTTIQAHITFINGAFHEHSEEELDRLRELIGGLFCEDISFARTNFKPIIDDGSELSVRRVLLLCHMVSMSAERLWKCRKFAIDTWQATETMRREFHVSFDSVRFDARLDLR